MVSGPLDVKWKSGRMRPLRTHRHPYIMKPTAPRRPARPRAHNPAKRRTSQRTAQDAAADDTTRLYGVHAVEAALRNPHRTIRRLLMTENAENRLKDAVSLRQVQPQRVTPRDLDRLLGPDTVHQGVVLETEPLDEPSLANVATAADATGPVVILDHVTDPHNVGAILRSCAAFGASALIMTRRHSPPLTGTLAKSASGALEHVPVVLVQNLARALTELKELGFTAIGLDDSADSYLEDEPFAGRVALVLGAEGKGLRELTRASCARLYRITTQGPIASLNVSNAAAVSLHLAALRRRAR